MGEEVWGLLSPCLLAGGIDIYGPDFGGYGEASRRSLVVVYSSVDVTAYRLKPALHEKNHLPKDLNEKSAVTVPMAQQTM